MKTLEQALSFRAKNALSFNAASPHKTSPILKHNIFDFAYFSAEAFGTDEFFTALECGFVLNTRYYYAGSLVERFIQHDKVLYAAVLPYDCEWNPNDYSVAEIKERISNNQEVDMCSLSQLALIMHLENDVFCYINMDADSKCGAIGFFKTTDSPAKVVEKIKEDLKRHDSEDGEIVEVSADYLQLHPFDGYHLRFSSTMNDRFQEHLSEISVSK